MHTIVKEEFSKFGFSTQVMETISKMITDEAGAEATDEQIKEKLVSYQPLAKVFQSEIDARVAKAKVKETEADKESKKDIEITSTDEMPAWAKAMNEKFDKIINKDTVQQKNSIVESKLKDLKMSDAEIKAVMLGREFKDDESVDTFVEQQKEIFKEILDTRVVDNLGNGTTPPKSSGASDIEAFKKELEEFNKIK